MRCVKSLELLTGVTFGLWRQRAVEYSVGRKKKVGALFDWPRLHDYPLVQSDDGLD